MKKRSLVLFCILLLLSSGFFSSSSIQGSMSKSMVNDGAFLSEKGSLILSDFACSHLTRTSLSDLIEQLNETMVLGYLENLTSIGPRRTGTPNCEEAALYLYQEFDAMGLEVRYQNWTLGDSIYGSNIEATLPGVNPSSDEIYLVCGHYDTVSKSPGADDDASGTVAVLTAALVMSQYHFDHTVRFLAVSGEEQGLLGSSAYAREASERGDNIVAVLNADMIGYAKTPEGESNIMVYDLDDESDWVTRVTENVGMEYYDEIHLNVIDGGYHGQSDHVSFLQQGYDAIFYFEYEFNPNYHTGMDIIKYMNPRYATKVSKLIMATLAELSNRVGYLPPNKPLPPDGPSTGTPDTIYSYRISTADPDGDPLSYLCDWGDNTTSGWIGPYESGESVEISHSWSDTGSFALTIKAKDSYGLESEWSDPLSVTIPKSHSSLSRSHWFNNLFSFIMTLVQNY
jgi:hypothetical protein